MKALKRLETASFTIEKIVDAGSNGNVLQEFLYGDKVLLIAHGHVVAGFDFELMGQSDITIQGKKITVILPSPIILYSRLDNEKTKVYDRTRGLLAPKNSDLEARARQAAEASIKTAACEGDILSQASDNGRKQMTLFFKSLGFSEVVITILVLYLLLYDIMKSILQTYLPTSYLSQKKASINNISILNYQFSNMKRG